MSLTLRIEHLTKYFRFYNSPGQRLIEYLSLRAIQYSALTPVLKNVNLELAAGESLLLTGGNGTGKSTLLKLIAGALTPSEGKIIRHGSLCAIIELGIGMRDDLSGRENAASAWMRLIKPKLSKEDYLHSVAEFAELAPVFLRPIKHYSSGMKARLAFATATAERADLLLLDEVLSVGDFNFQKKCLTRLKAYQKLGSTLLVVSHLLRTEFRFSRTAPIASLQQA